MTAPDNPLCTKVAGEGAKPMALCVLASQVATERKARLDEILSYAADGLLDEQLASTVLRRIVELARDEGLIGLVPRDEVVIEVVKVLDEKMNAEASIHTENAIAVANLLTSQGWLVVQSDPQ